MPGWNLQKRRKKNGNLANFLLWHEDLSFCKESAKCFDAHLQVQTDAGCILFGMNWSQLQSLVILHGYQSWQNILWEKNSKIADFWGKKVEKLVTKMMRIAVKIAVDAAFLAKNWPPMKTDYGPTIYRPPLSYRKCEDLRSVHRKTHEDTYHPLQIKFYF